MSLSPELLDALRTAGLAIEPHATYTNEWFAAGKLGPFHSSEAALVGGVRWLCRLSAEAREEADNLRIVVGATEDRVAEAEEEAQRLRTALAAA